jgi:hypothetical protein
VTARHLTLTPDGYRYMQMSKRRVCRPFHLRWLLPFLCRQSIVRWQLVGKSSVIAVGLLTWAYTGSVWMVCVAALPMMRLTWHRPVLTDVPGLAFALAAAVLWPIYWPAALLVAAIGACVRETTPIFAALFAWNPVLLLGLIPVAIRWFVPQGDDVLDGDVADVVRHPFRAGWQSHSARLLDPQLMLLPWGALLVALGAVDWQLAATVAVAYAQIFVATDTVRLYQWAAPVVALAAVNAVPAAWLPLVAAFTVWNPWRGNDP